MALSPLQNLLLETYISGAFNRRINSPAAFSKDPQVLSNEVQGMIMVNKVEIMAAMLTCQWAEQTFSSEAIAGSIKSNTAATQSALATKAEQDRVMARQGILANRANIAKEEQRRKVDPSGTPMIDLAAAKSGLTASEKAFAATYGNAALKALGI